MIVLSEKKLGRLGTEIFVAQGIPRSVAELIAETLVEANLTGHDSHGVSYFLTYSERIENGFIKTRAKPTVAEETSTSALIDGCWAPGQLTAMKIIEVAVEKAKKNVVSVVGAYNCNHVGRIGYYTGWAAQRGVIAMMFVNVGNPLVSVYGGRGRVTGTNPFSAAVPTSSETFLLDYATSTVALGKLKIAIEKNEKIPENWIRDKTGCLTDDPTDFKEGGWLLPFGEHKGYCLQLLCEILGSILTGSRSCIDPLLEPPSTNGVLALAINPDFFVGSEKFRHEAGVLLSKIRNVEPLPGKKVLIPGEPELITKEQRLREGIRLQEEVWEKICSLANRLGVDERFYHFEKETV